MSTVDKFSYLRSLLEGPASTSIAGFSQTTKPLLNCWRRYGKRNVTQRAHIQEMLTNMKPVYNQKNTPRLRTLHDTVELNYQSFEALGVGDESYSSIIVPAVMEKLPTLVRMIMKREADHIEWSLGEMLASLLREELNLASQGSQGSSKNNNGSNQGFNRN